jgi:hypothetical protein
MTNEQELIRQVVNSGEPEEFIRETLLELGVPEDDIEIVMNLYRFRPYFLSNSNILGNIPGHSYDHSSIKWNSYIQYLRSVAENKNFDPTEQINSISESTNKVEPFLMNSIQYGRTTYGLVVGDVQSGKTANFCGLISKSGDLGIPIIIVLSGITNTLRNQTQKRIDEALKRSQINSNQWYFLTEQDKSITNRSGNEKMVSGDFSNNHLELDLGALMEQNLPIILVMKKRKRVLERLNHWFTNYSDLLSTKQILVIDDEADSASVNCAVPNGEDHGVIIDEEEATAINRLIRTCLGRSTMSIYIGYTATPYASLLTDPWDFSEELGYGLYPRDFILTLPQPTSHNGTNEFFSDFGYLQNQVSILHRANDVGVVNQLDPPSLPLSLKNSVIDFIISGAILISRDRLFHHSMLIHCHHRKDNHENLERLIRVYGMEIRRNYHRETFSGERFEIFNTFRERWQYEFGIDVEYTENLDSNVKKFLREFDWMTNVRSINSNENEDDDSQLYDVPKLLDYDNYENGLRVIAVGGTILSRGLTVEGLKISYFTRESALYDSLTQMARWYGYHGDDSDLIRVNITDQIHRWFRWIHHVETRIREDIARYDEFEGVSPLMLAPRILKYAETEPLPHEIRPRNFLPTRRNAMPTAESRGLGFSGTYHSSRYLPFNVPEHLRQNEDLYKQLIEGISGTWTPTSGGYISRNINPHAIIEFLSNFNHSEGERSLGQQDIINYINRRNESNELINWSVAVMSPSSNRVARTPRPDSELPPINVTGRGRNPGGSLDEIMDKVHVAIDLPGYPHNFRNITSVRLAARQQRDPEYGLLLLYILDSEFIPREGIRGFVPLYTDEQEKIDAVAFGIALPDSETARNEDAQQEEYWIPRGIDGEF